MDKIPESLDVCDARNGGAARVDLSVERLIRALDQSELSSTQVARLSGVNAKTIRGWIERGRASRKHLAKVAKAIDCSVRYLEGKEPLPSQEPDPISVRRVDGHYSLRGQDVEVPDHFEYRSGGKSSKGEIELWHDDSDPKKLWGKGIDQDGDEISVEARLEDNLIIRGLYRINNPRLSVYGAIMGQFALDGKTIHGHYFSRASGQDSASGLVFGQFTLERVDDGWHQASTQTPSR